MTGPALCFGDARDTQEDENKDRTVPGLQAKRDRKASASFSLGTSRDSPAGRQQDRQVGPGWQRLEQAKTPSTQ